MSSARKSSTHRHRNNVCFEQRPLRKTTATKYHSTKRTVEAVLRGVFTECDLLYPFVNIEADPQLLIVDEIQHTKRNQLEIQEARARPSLRRPMARYLDINNFIGDVGQPPETQLTAQQGLFLENNIAELAFEGSNEMHHC